MKRQHKLFYLTILVFTACCLSCKKFVEIPPPKNQLVNSAVFADSTNATAAVLGIYISMMQSVGLGMPSGGLTLYPGLSADELLPSANSNDEKEFYNNSILPGNSTNSDLWRGAYSLIYNANACLEGLASGNNISASCKNQLIGETKFVRAFLYFNLINLYGSVPLVTSTDYHKNQVLGREPAEDIYNGIISDLKEAQTLLSPAYPSLNRLRPNQYTVTALLSKVYLFRKNWDLSEQAATQIINSGVYKLETNLNNVFLASSNEAIWKLSPVFPGVETWEGYYFVPTSSSIIPKYVISNSLLSAFETGDQRKDNWLKSNTVNGQPYYYPYKYKLGYDGASVPKENYMVFRLAEQYLIRAEARVRQGNVNGALQDLNLIRSRAGLPDFTNTDQNVLLAAIQHERQVELFCEWANRWFDLKRTNNADAVLGSVKGSNWQATDMLYPIPQAEISKNPFLTQNAGY